LGNFTGGQGIRAAPHEKPEDGHALRVTEDTKSIDEF
jgi:hypothetical protein